MSEQNVLELAKNGNANAISALMNRSLKQRGITAKAIRKDDSLRIMLEANEVPNQSKLVEFVSHGIRNLKVVGINRIELFGRQVGDDVPAWSQTVILESSHSSHFQNQEISSSSHSVKNNLTPEDETKFKVKSHGKELTTSSIEELENWIHEGLISLTDYVYNPILKKWMYVRDLAEIESIVKERKSAIEVREYNQASGIFVGLDYWKNWNSGGRIIFASACTALISMFMTWVDIGIAQKNGFDQQAFLLLVFWIYPVFRLLKNKMINGVFGLLSSIASVILIIGYINSKSGELINRTVNFSGTGAWVFLFASIALGVGIVKYVPGGVYDTNKEKIDIRKIREKLLGLITPSKNKTPKSRVTTGILAILIGGLGIHFFYLDIWGWGIVSILLCWTYIPAVAGIVVGIRCLLMSDKEFERKVKKIKGAFGPIEF